MPSSAVLAFDLNNPNFVAGDTGSILRVREVLAEEILTSGPSMSREVEEHLARAKERELNRAVLRTWEEAWWEGGDRKHNHDELRGIGVCSCGAELHRGIAESYWTRREKIEAGAGGPALKPLDMDPQVARDEIDRLMRAPRPKDFEQRINDLRAVLGLEAVEFPDTYDPAPMIVQEGETAAMQPVRAPLTKVENFLSMEWKDQKRIVETETDLEFLDAMRRKKLVIPAVKVAIKKRLLFLSTPAAEE